MDEERKVSDEEYEKDQKFQAEMESLLESKETIMKMIADYERKIYLLKRSVEGFMQSIDNIEGRITVLYLENDYVLDNNGNWTKTSLVGEEK